MVPLATKKFDTIQKYKEKNTNTSLQHQRVEIQDQEHSTKVDGDDAEFDDALKDFMQMRVLETVYEEDERSWASPGEVQDPEIAQPVSLSTTEQSSFRQLLESSPNHLVQTKTFQKKNKTTPTESALKFLRYFAKSTFSPVSIFFTLHNFFLLLYFWFTL